MLGVDWRRRRLLQQGGALAGLALLGRWSRLLQGPAPSATSFTPASDQEGELWEGFLLLPPGAPLPPWVQCVPAPILCQTDGPEDPELRGEVIEFSDQETLRRTLPFPFYRPAGIPLRRVVVIRFQRNRQVFSVRLDFGREMEPGISLWMQPIFPRPYPVWPVHSPRDPERVIKPEKVFFTPKPGVMRPTFSGLQIHWIEPAGLYTLIVEGDPRPEAAMQIVSSMSLF